MPSPYMERLTLQNILGKKLKKEKKEEQKELFLLAYEEHADALFRFAYFQLGQREMAKDAVQDVFLNTWQYCARGEEVENMKAFLFASLRNKIIDFRRKKKEESLDRLEEEGFDAPDFQSHKKMEESAEAKRIFFLIGEMDCALSEPLLLRFAEGLGVKEIAGILGENENVISLRIHRGLKQIKKTLKIE